MGRSTDPGLLHLAVVCAKVKAGAGEGGMRVDLSGDKTSVLQSVAAPILGLFERARKLVGQTSCEPFYAGIVQHPT